MNDAHALLTADCGNSTIDCQRHADGARVRIAADQPVDAVAAALRAFVLGGTVRRCIAVSVAPEALARLRAMLAALQVPLAVAGDDVRCPLPLDYETPHTLGADRWVGALAAWRLHGRAVVLDCGSATTVNLVDADGTFRGGAIAPGLRALAAGMAAATPALPAPDLDAAIAMPPRATQAAVDTGVLLGWCGLVERLAAAALHASRGPATLVVTGGNAERLLRHTRLRPVHVPDLVHRGLRGLATEPRRG
jgi:type III pantothenate kinase